MAVEKQTVSTDNLENTYTYKEVYESSLEYFSGDELAATSWMNKYAVKDKIGNFIELNPHDMHVRMAKEFARIEEKYEANNGDLFASSLSEYGTKRQPLTFDRILSYFEQFKAIIPQGSVMAALGNNHMIASLSNCVVMPSPFDSYGGILQTDQQLAQLFKRRCGVGIDLSSLRPSGQDVSNAAGTTSGAVSFMERYSNTTREVAQNGRRGALMLTMDIAHPDVEQFITIKQDLSKVTGANISVRLSDEFMKAVDNNEEYTHKWPIDSANPSVTKTVNAKDLWETIIQCAHTSAEPGLIFWDRQHWYSTSSVYPGYENLSTNPCSEIAMQGGDSCRLIALNLFNFVENPFTPEAKFNFEGFYEATYEGQRLNDDLVDLELEAIDRILRKVQKDPEPSEIKSNEIETWKLLSETGRKGRRTGLGFTALADAIAALNIKFDSDESISVINEIMRTKCKAEFDSSIDMSITRGSFEGFNPEIESNSEFVEMLKTEFPELHKRMMENGRRNISLSTVAPTGTLSLLAQTSSGIEPVFLTSYKRRRKISGNTDPEKVSFVDELGDAWEEFTVYHKNLKEWMEITGETDESKSPYAGSTAPEIDWLKRVEIQSLVQKYTTHSISSTINLPEDVAMQKVGDIYLESWKQGLKGITVYRDGSRSGVLVSTEEKPKEEATSMNTAPTRPEVLDAKVIRFKNENEDWLAVVGLLNDRPYEIFTGKAEDAFALPQYVSQGWIIKNAEEENTRYDFRYKDSAGFKVTIEGLSRSFNKEFWNYAKLISGVLRHGMPLPYVVDMISNLHLDKDYINTWTNGVARALKSFIKDGTQAVDKTCSSCGDQEGLIYEEGCLKCKSCGYTKCG